MEEYISNCQGINGVNIKNNKGSHSLTASVETMAFLTITSVPLVNNSGNFINQTSPKQQIIKNIRRKSDVSMSNSKNASTQEVRQKDIDDAQAIEDEKIDKYYKLLDQKIDLKYENLSSQINNTEKKINQNIDARNKRTTWIISGISIAVTILGIAVNVALFFLRK